VQEEWKDLLEASLITSEGDAMEEIVQDVGPPGIDALEKGEVGGQDEIRAVVGWSRAIAPTSVPIGVIQREDAAQGTFEL
jgi:hypothetical protein